MERKDRTGGAGPGAQSTGTIRKKAGARKENRPYRATARGYTATKEAEKQEEKRLGEMGNM